MTPERRTRRQRKLALTTPRVITSSPKAESIENRKRPRVEEDPSEHAVSSVPITKKLRTAKTYDELQDLADSCETLYPYVEFTGGILQKFQWLFEDEIAKVLFILFFSILFFDIHIN